jgi:hypothetical protein
MSISGHKIRILALHGYGQTPAMFREKSGALRGQLKKKVEFVYLQAPHNVVKASSSSGDAIEQLGYSWFDFDSDGLTGGKDHSLSEMKEEDAASSLCGPQLRSALFALQECFTKEGPFDGVIGFSQGACLAILLSALQESRFRQLQIKPSSTADGMESMSTKPPMTLHPSISFKWVATFSGFLCDHKDIYTPVYELVKFIDTTYQKEKIVLPSFHCFGTADEIIPAALSERAASLFVDPIIDNHPGGHYLPSSKALALSLKDFIFKHSTAE